MPEASDPTKKWAFAHCVLRQIRHYDTTVFIPNYTRLNLKRQTGLAARRAYLLVIHSMAGVWGETPVDTTQVA